ncbi:RsmB/NOP family class I SAM-dependent RNA methyltransferase [Acidisoma silvae]|uniref:RsmB/NOP family class I SAM-dependent RNA methyltransferase n=1 Tax=Acidisoma silvae TaxID=2802396 RepID=A0A963YPC6_9PROT|nr:RsmB/NOP family class I SAM-dependent RNA methyltransferase [Acidisoma silvae]MCB8874327.1 RsmB/NOP family class I SAM-dependent RNA methyltransferase [Acidisoma silvae]
MTPNARFEAAIALLEAIAAAPRKPADAVANDFFRSRRYIGGGDRRAVAEQAWSVLRQHRRLTWWIERAQGQPSGRMLVAAAAILGGQIYGDVCAMFSGGRYGPQPLEADEAEILRRLKDHTIEHPAMPPAVRLEVPDWIYPLLEARFGAETDREIAAMLAPAPLDLRVNMLKGNRQQAIDALAAEGITAKSGRFSPWGLRVEGRRPVVTGEAFQSGLIEIQDEGSQIVALMAEPQPGMRVLDYCAGAGGKTLAMAMMMENKGHILAADTSAPRLDGAVRRLRRAGVHNVEQHLLTDGDGKWAKRRRETYDRVLVDAPCTGTGTWRRNPDARARLTEQDLSELVAKQAVILQEASRFLRKGGRLVYATCSILPAENEEQVQRFLAANADFTQVAPTRPEAAKLARDGMVHLTPASHGTDGFFAAVLERA